MKILLFVFPLIFCNSVLSTTKKGPLIIFHIDLNSVSLQESYIKKWLKNASDMGYNAVLWEVENEIQWDTCPECVSPDAFSKDKFRRILKYSRELGLEPIPLLQTIGHAEYVLQHEKYIPLREDPERYDCYCTSKPEVRRFLKQWVKEYLELFGPLKHFHLGGDEAYAFASCPECSARADEIGKNRLYAEHMLDIAQPILEKGIRPGIWCDMILAEVNEISAIPKDFVIWDWNYWDGDETPERVMVWGSGLLSKERITDSLINMFPEIVDKHGDLRAFYTVDVLKRFGYDVILCSASRTYGDGVYAAEHDHHAPNIIGAAKKTIETGILGNCVTSWAIRISNYETQHAWFYLGPLTLKNPSLPHKDLLVKASYDIFGTNNDDFFKAITLAGRAFPFVNNRTTGIQWTNLKDSRPAPPGYIEGLIEKWKTQQDGRTWNTNTGIIKSIPADIQKGITLLNEFIPKANGGFETLGAWSKAGYFQYWHAFVANEIVRKAEGKSKISKQDMVELMNSLRSEYKNWAGTWMTPKSAEINSGLIFDAISAYFSDCK